MKVSRNREGTNIIELPLDKCIILLGPNGTGKTSILLSTKGFLLEARDRMLGYEESYKPMSIAAKFSSEGEGMDILLTQYMKEVGRAVGKYKILCIDSLDSGYSLNMLKKFSDFTRKYLLKDFKTVLITANSYEMIDVFPEAKIFWVPTGEFIQIKSYEEFKKLF
jgi:energy-coupling factor transporter ATP-binding protein EcfA2